MARDKIADPVAIAVRLNTAIMVLEEAAKLVPSGRGFEEWFSLNDNLGSALSHARRARARLSDTKSDTTG